MSNRRMFLAALVGAIVTAAVPEAIARRGRRASFRVPGLPNGVTPKGPVLSREQLRQCVAQQNAVNQRMSHVDNLQAALTRDEKVLNDLSARITAQEPLVDQYSQASVDGFNALVEQHGRMVDTYNGKLPGVNAQVEDANAAVDAFNTKCAERAYYESDMQAVLAGR